MGPVDQLSSFVR